MPEDKIVEVALPIEKEDMVKLFNHLSEYTFSIDYKKSLDNLKSNNKILTYIANCEMINTLLREYEYDDNLEDLLLEYIKFDRPVSVPILSDIWCSILNNKDKYISDEKLLDFIKLFRENHKDIIDECNSFFYSLKKALENIIVPTAKDLEDKIAVAEPNKLKLCGINIVSLEDAVDFYQYIGHLDLGKIYLYDEFVHNVLNGMSVTYHFITEDPFFRNLYIYNKFNSNPKEETKKLKAILDKLNSSRGE